MFQRQERHFFKLFVPLLSPETAVLFSVTYSIRSSIQTDRQTDRQIEGDYSYLNAVVVLGMFLLASTNRADGGSGGGPGLPRKKFN